MLLEYAKSAGGGSGVVGRTQVCGSAKLRFGICWLGVRGVPLLTFLTFDFGGTGSLPHSFRNREQKTLFHYPPSTVVRCSSSTAHSSMY